MLQRKWSKRLGGTAIHFFCLEDAEALGESYEFEDITK